MFYEARGEICRLLSTKTSTPIEGSDRRRFFAVLHQAPVTSPVEAVRAAIVAEHKGGP